MATKASTTTTRGTTSPSQTPSPSVAITSTSTTEVETETETQKEMPTAAATTTTTRTKPAGALAIMPANSLALNTSLTAAQALCKTVATLRRVQSTPAFMIDDDLVTTVVTNSTSSPDSNGEIEYGVFNGTDHASQSRAVFALSALASSGKVSLQRQLEQSDETDNAVVRLTPAEERSREPTGQAPEQTEPPQSEQSFGCVHYKRRAMFVTPCCNKFYKCRFCHDENESHHFDRKTLTELICAECNTRQKVQEFCEKCGVRFGKYTCLICNLFDDSDKQQYHCDACGICRIGGAQNFFHCEVCNMCLPIQLKIDGHRCVENMSRSNCPVCLGDIHTSRIPCHIPDCGHLLHKMCFDQLLNSGHYTCPTCQTSLIDMTALWEYLDIQALRMPVPKTYENKRIHIFCNDCHKTSNTNFHFIGLKCMYCGAYNTTQDMKRRRSLVTEEPSTA